jgi:hypothetical protein
MGTMTGWTLLLCPRTVLVWRREMQMVNSGFGTYRRGGSLDVLGPWDAHGGSAVTCMAWSLGGRHITSCTSDEAMLKIWDLGRCITWNFEGEHEKRGVKRDCVALAPHIVLMEVAVGRA